jgi:SAM-dependent methyltransferase
LLIHHEAVCEFLMNDSEAYKTEEVACALCGSDDGKYLFDARDRFLDHSDSFPVVRCRHCDLVYLNPRPSAAEQKRFYSSDYAFAAGSEGQKLEHYRPVMEYLDQQPPGKVLDVGTGNSPFLPAMKERGWQVEGTEVDESYEKFFAENHQIKVFCGELAEAKYDDGSFDAVTIMGVLEHVSEPMKALKESNRVLKEDGALCLWVFNRSIEAKLLGRHWLGFDAPRHLYSFSLPVIERMLSEAGFEIDRIYCRSHSIMQITTIRALAKLRNVITRQQRPVHAVKIPNPIRIAYLPLGKILGALNKTSDVYVFARKKGQEKAAVNSHTDDG